MGEWRKVRLGEVTRSFDSRRAPVKAQDRVSGPYPYYGASGVVDYVDKYLFDGEYLLVAEDGENLRTRKTPIAFMASGKFWVNNHAHVLQGNDSVSSRFLGYLLAGMDVSGYLSGSTQPKLTQAALNSIQLVVPDRRTQDAAIELLGALDDKMALNGRICETSLALADCYSHAVHEDGSAVPSATIGQLVMGGQLEFGDGYRTKRAEHGQPGLPILRVAEVADGEIRPSFADYVRDEFRGAMGRKISQAGDVVLTTKGTVGRVALMATDAPEFVYSPQVCYFRIKPDAQLSSIYLFHWMRGPEFWRQAAGMKGQTDMADYLSLGDIKSLRITLPSRAVLAEFDRKCAPLHARSAAARAENRTLADLRDTLLPQLLSGKLRVKDAVRAVEEVV
jgi:type I restriction enzyme S subunit